MTYPSRETVQQRLEAAKAVFLANDTHLLEVNSSERSMTHKFAEALQQVFRSWHVDCEYSRSGHDPRCYKCLPDWALSQIDATGRVFPDIIVHRRGKKWNAVVIEAKTSNADRERVRADREKLRAFKRELGYRHAVQLTFHVETPQVTWEFID